MAASLFILEKETFHVCFREEENDELYRKTFCQKTFKAEYRSQDRLRLTATFSIGLEENCMQFVGT